MKKERRLFETVWICLGVVAIFGVICRAQAQDAGPRFVVDPNWPKPLPEKWAIGQVSGVCVDAQDNVFIVNRNDVTDKEEEIARQAPPYIEFDPEGNVVNSFGDWTVVPNVTHGCNIDYENNFWTAGNGDGIVQKYSHDGKLLMQIGKRGVLDTSDGTLKGRALNSSQTRFYMPSEDSDWCGTVVPRCVPLCAHRLAVCARAESSQPPPNASIKSTLARSCRVSSVSASS